MFNSLFKTVNVRNDVQSLMTDSFDHYLTPDMTVYDIGCGSKPFVKTLEPKVKAYIGVDIEDGFYDASHIDLVGTAYEVPVEADTVDAIISCQVLEHLERPQDAVKEAARILKKDGLFFLSFPFLYPIHADPVDHNRMTEYFMQSLLEREGFEVLDMKRLGGFWYLTGMFLFIYLQPINRGILKKTKVGGALLWLVAWVFNLLHLLEGGLLKILKKNPETIRRQWTVNYVMVARKVAKKVKK